jgi:hypothetical protein
MLFLAAVSGLMLAIDFRLEAYREEYVFEQGSIRVPVCAGLAMATLVVAFAGSDTNAFIYFQF